MTGAGTGIAGVVAASSDVVTDGCSECPLGKAMMAIWSVDVPVSTTAEARLLLDERAADTAENVDERYYLSLEPGPYLLCVRPNCIGLSVEADETLTVNIKLRNGPTSFFAGHPGEERLEEDFGFEVGY